VNQPAKLLAYLQRHGSITTMEAFQNLGITCVHKRIADLERLDFVIEHKDEKVPNRDGKMVTVCRYKLISEPERISV